MKTKFILIIGIVLLSSYSCQKNKLYPALPTSVATQDGLPFSTVLRINAQVLALYSGLRSGNLYGGRFEVYNDVKADNWINATANSVTAYQTWTETVNPTSQEVTGLWSQCYSVINNCNLFIDGMPLYGNSVLNNAALSTNYIGEAKFCRALAYLALLDMYCQAYSVSGGATPGVPLRLVGLSLYGNYPMAPSTVAQCYAQVITDLNDAETALPVAYYTQTTPTLVLDGVNNVVRASKNTAIAFKTRAYLAMGQYANVITEANKIVSTAAPFTASFTAATGVSYALQPVIGNVFKTPYTTSESVFSEPFVNSTETPGGQSALADYFNTTGATEFYLNATSALLTDPLWKTTDARRGFISTNTKSGRQNLTKEALGSPYVDWVPTMRYSEVLLNLAEARSMSIGATDPKAIALLNAVRQRSDPSTTFTTATQAQILEERNIEFLGEGLRWFDLLRTGQAIPAKGTVTAIPVAGFNSAYIWPMSNGEQLTNPLIGR